MPQVRTTRDRIKRELEQANGLLDNVLDYLAYAGSEFLATIPSEDEMKVKIAQGYPPDYRDKMSARIEMCYALTENIEEIKVAIAKLRNEI